MNVVGALQEQLRKDCLYDDTFFDFVLGAIHLVPYVVSFAFLGISIATREIFYTVLSGALWFNTILNYTLTWILADPAPVITCGGKAALPAFFSEHSFFLYVFVVTSYYLYNLRLNSLHIFLLQVWVIMSWVSSVILGYNYKYQVIWGASVGSYAAVVVQIFVYNIIWKNRTKLMQFKIVSAFYRDSIFEPNYKAWLSDAELQKISSEVAMDGSEHRMYITQDEVMNILRIHFGHHNE